MKLLVFAHRPPPHHGQSAMVAALLDGLRDDPAINILHVDARLSRDAADVGRWRFRKLFALLGAVTRAWCLRFRHGDAAFYYIPAPGKRTALYRDWLVLLLCRPFFSRLVLHWHAAGLGEWLHHRATFVERSVSRALLGRADLALVLGDSLRAEAGLFHPRRTTVVRNGIPDPCPGFTRTDNRSAPFFEAIFVGLCSRDKGLFTAIAGVLEANQRLAAAACQPFRLTFAGAFPDAATTREFEALAATDPDRIRYVGFVSGLAKDDLFARANVLVFPTVYAAETQGLVVAEALAYDLPVITTRWRAVSENLPKSHIHLVAPHNPAQIADALLAVQAAPPPSGQLRAHFLAHYTLERHLAGLREALRSVQA